MSPKKSGRSERLDHDIQRLLPLRPVDLQVLLVLAGEGELHGYGIMKRVEEQSGGRVRLEVGSLYRVMGRLLEEGLIEPAPKLRKASDDPRRKRLYRISDHGAEVMRAEVDRLRGVIETARAQRLVPR